MLVGDVGVEVEQVEDGDIPGTGEDTAPEQSAEEAEAEKAAAELEAKIEATVDAFKAMNDALSDPKLIARLADLGGVPMKGSAEDFGKVIVSETEKWKKVVEFSGASVE